MSTELHPRKVNPPSLQIVGVTAGDAGTYTAFADNGLGPPATAAVSLSVDPASSDGGTNVPASVIELEPGKTDALLSDKMPHRVGFVNCFLSDSLALPWQQCSGQQGRNSQETVFKTYSMRHFVSMFIHHQRHFP